MSKHYFIAGEGALWAQPDGPNTAVYYLGCHQIGDIERGRGDFEPIYCKDPSGPNRFKVVNVVQGAAPLITTNIDAKMTEDLDRLERADCAFTLFVTQSKAGRADLFTNFDRVMVLGNVRISSDTYSGLSAMSAEDNASSMVSFEVSAESLLVLAEYTISRQSISETSNIADIAFLDERRCRTDENVAQKQTEIGYASTTAPTGSPSTTANVIHTTNGGTWAATAADPFAATEDVIAVETFYMGRNTHRVLVARGTTDAGNPAEVAYSDDEGTTWTQANVGSVTGQYVPTRHSLHALNSKNIWIATATGYIYKSSDGGATWTAQLSGTITAGAINAVRMVDDEVGWMGAAANVLGRTIDAGVSWEAITGPSAQAGVAVNVVEPLDQNRVYVGYADGDVYYTLDAGVNWSQITTFTGSGVGQIRDIRFWDDNLGFITRNNASPLGAVLWTVNGGVDWTDITVPTNVGLNAMALMTEWDFFLAGQAQAGTGFIGRGAV